MGRRKKEPESAHREHISSAAERLFLHKGIESTTMDDIAKEAGYSKATLYVYFRNKDEIIGYLVLKSMKMLHSFIFEAVSAPEGIRGKYNKICQALVQYQKQYPLYFTLALREINIDFEQDQYLTVERETYEVGEQINVELARFIRSGIETGEFLPDVPILQTVFLFWASLAGIVQMAANKQSYIEKAMNLTREQFLDFGFDRLYRLIGKENR